MKPPKESVKNYQKTHRVKGVLHYNIKDQCILCSGVAPSAHGQKTGGKW